jgi:hypothetical protein
MGDVNDRDGDAPTALATLMPERARARIGARVLTVELATRFSEVLLEDLSHSVETAALAAGLRPSTVRDAISRYHNDKCSTLSDEEVCEIVYRAKAEHIKQIRFAGYVCAGKLNRAGTAWMQWQLEVQAPLEHPRKQQTEVQHSGPNGGPIQTESAVRYVVSVPPEEEIEE